ncbi:hypothetical protein [Jiella mangrovi]|uniref:Uncharacterized protein n=1 Tax=Jiella mangrovi TaxID=2821407 RepID=A0ABS4BGT6_9HYPH|nr:hypothetical protein [Jiella mangrovi]MBP0615757.1 hypothetical protein [Jiella mangrovi]
MDIDSNMEIGNLTIAVARPDVSGVAVQLGPFFYGHGDQRRRHFFDAGVWRSNGLHLFAVKPRRSSRYQGLLEILKLLQRDDQRLASAHLYAVNEDHLAPWQIHRAKLINRALALTDDEADQVAMDCIAAAEGPIQVVDIYLRTKLGHRCLSAVARLVAHGKVVMPHRALLDTDAFVEAAEKEVRR